MLKYGFIASWERSIHISIIRLASETGYSLFLSEVLVVGIGLLLYQSRWDDPLSKRAGDELDMLVSGNIVSNDGSIGS